MTENSDEELEHSQITTATLNAMYHGGVDPQWGKEMSHFSSRGDTGSWVWKHANTFALKKDMVICKVGECRKVLNIGVSRSTSVISKHLNTAHNMRQQEVNINAKKRKQEFLKAQLILSIFKNKCLLGLISTYMVVCRQ